MQNALFAFDIGRKGQPPLKLGRVDKRLFGVLQIAERRVVFVFRGGRHGRCTG